MNSLVLAFGSVALSVAAQFALRRGMAQAAGSAQSQELPLWWAAVQSPFVALGLLLYVASALIWLGVLSRWEVSKAYPLVGLGFVATLAVAWALGEQVGPMRAAGVLLIAAGVVMVARS